MTGPSRDRPIDGDHGAPVEAPPPPAAASSSDAEPGAPPMKGDRFRCDCCGVEVEVVEDCDRPDARHVRLSCCDRPMTRVV